MHKAPNKLALIYAKNKSRDGTFCALDLENKSLEVLEFEQFRQIKEPGFCWVKDSTYFVCGGKAGAKGDESSARTFLVDVVTKEVKELPKMNVGKFTCLPTHDNGLVYAPGIYQSKGGYNLMIEVYNLQANSWTVLSETSTPNNGLVRTFKYKNKICVITLRTEFTAYDLESKTWGDESTFVYDFDDFYVTQTGRCVTVYAYHNAICEYIYPDDEICTINTFDSFRGTNHSFYLPELDAIVFIDQWKHKSYGIYYNQTNESKSFGAEECKFFGEMAFYVGAQGGPLAPKQLTDSFISVDGKPFDQKAYMFGLWHIPFKLVIDFKEGEESVKVERIPESLFLKFHQGVEIIDDSRLIFAGGYADDYSVFSSSDAMIYDVDTNQLKICEDLKAENYDTVLKKISLISFEAKSEKTGFIQQLFEKKPKAVSLSDPNVYDVFLANNSDEFEVWNSQTENWEILAKSGSQNSPSFLDVPDRIILVESSYPTEKSKVFIALREYDFKSKSFKLLYNKKSDYSLTSDFTLKIADNQFLVVVNSDTYKESFAKMTLIWDKDVISDLKLDLICPLDEKEVKGSSLRYFLMGRQMFIVLVVAEWVVKYKCFDLDKLAYVESPRVEKIGKLLDQALLSMGIKESKWRIKDFNIVSNK